MYGYLKILLSYLSNPKLNLIIPLDLQFLGIKPENYFECAKDPVFW